MSNLKAFLAPTVNNQTQERVISERFCNKDGKPVPFKVRAITQEENNQLIHKATKHERDKGQVYERLDKVRYQSSLVVACTVEPDFTLKEMCDAYGAVDPLSVPGKMLFAGEFAKLVEFIMEVNNFRDVDEMEEEAKNSSPETTPTQS